MIWRINVKWWACLINHTCCTPRFQPTRMARMQRRHRMIEWIDSPAHKSSTHQLYSRLGELFKKTYIVHQSSIDIDLMLSLSTLAHWHPYQGEYVVAGSSGSARARTQVQPSKPMTSVPLKVSICDEKDKTRQYELLCDWVG